MRQLCSFTFCVSVPLAILAAMASAFFFAMLSATEIAFAGWAVASGIVCEGGIQRGGNRLCGCRDDKAKKCDERRMLDYRSAIF